MSRPRSWTVGTVVSVFVSVGVIGLLAACAEGNPPDINPGATNDPTDPDRKDSSASLPPPSNDGDAEPKDSGKKDSGKAPDSGKDADPGVDAGPCTTVGPSNVCGLAPQCGCGPNQTCDVTTPATGATACISAGTTPQGSACAASTQCAAGLTCIYGTCRPYCSTANTACTGAGLGLCGQLYNPATTPPTPYPNSKFCTIACSPRNPSAACGTNTCVWDGDLDTTDCDVAGTGDIGDPCLAYNDCRPGMSCGPGLFGNECQTWCRLGGSDCAFDEICADVYGVGGPTEGGVALGLCQLDF